MIGWGLFSGVMTGVVVLAISPALPHVFTSDTAVVAWPPSCCCTSASPSRPREWCSPSTAC